MALLRTRRSATVAITAVAAAALAACGDPAARVRIVARGGNCARPPEANAVRVIAYTAGGETARSVGLDQTLAIADFPADTEQIGIEVLAGGGAIGAQGKSSPLVFDALPDGATIPVLMAPPDGFCELPGMHEARAQPLVARAGNGALVVGGIGPSGPLSTVEYYDPIEAVFVPVEVPTGLVDEQQGFTGAALATLPDGRVAVVGGPSSGFVVFDPDRRAFVTEPTVITRRAFHAAIATGEREVLVAGGCSGVVALACDGRPLLQNLRYTLDRLSLPDPAGILAAGFRLSPRLFDLGVQLDGKRRFALAGGSGGSRGDPPRTDRFALDDINAEAVPGGHVQAAALDGGAVLTAFGDDVASAEVGAAVLAPGAAAPLAIADAPVAMKGVRLIALEDGRVVGFGGDPMGKVLTYDPTRDAWSLAKPMSPAQTGALAAPSLARLADGTVLVVGGAMSTRAWLYRPSLVGPSAGSVVAVPANDAGRIVLTAPDPATVTRVVNPAAWRLTTPAGTDMARALVGGPRMALGSVLAVVHVAAGGVALIAQETGPGHAIVARLRPGSPAQIVQLDGGGERTLCSGQAALPAFDAIMPSSLRLTLLDGRARLTLDGNELASCPVAAAERGAWGVAALGAGAQLTVDSVTVARGRPAA